MSYLVEIFYRDGRRECADFNDMTDAINHAQTYKMLVFSGKVEDVLIFPITRGNQIHFHM